MTTSTRHPSPPGRSPLDRGRRSASGSPDRRRRRPRPGPVPERRAVRAEPGACASAGGPAPSRSRRSRPRSRPPRPTRTTRERRRRRPSSTTRAGRQPDRLRRRRDVRRQRPRLLHPGCPERVHDVAARAGPRLRLGHAQVVPDVRHAPERLLRRRDDRARRIRARRRARAPRQQGRRLGLPRRGRPDLLADEAERRLEHACASVAATSRRSSSSTT